MRSVPQPLPPQASAPVPRDIYLDVLRGIAILLVLGRHRPFAVADNAVGASLFAAWMRVGWAGVDLFFVLSGFLIGGLLLAERRKYGEIRFGRFFLRRGFKIWPTYLVFLAIGFARDVLDVAPADVGLSLAARIHQSARAIWPFFIHIQNYRETEIHSVIGTAWSLAVEEHFYLLLPLLLFALGRLAPRPTESLLQPPADPYRALPWIGAALGGVCLALRVYTRRVHPQWDEFVHHLPTHLRIDSLFAGVTLAYGVHFARARVESLRPYRYLMLAASVACFVPFARDTQRFAYTTPLTTTFGYSLLMLGSMGLVLAAWFASHPTAAQAGQTTTRSCTRPINAAVRALAVIGVRSYSIYLFHVLLAVPVVMYLRSVVGHEGSPIHAPAMMALYLSLAIAIGATAYWMIEAPSVALRDWLFPARSATRSAAFVTADVPTSRLPHTRRPKLRPARQSTVLPFRRGRRAAAEEVSSTRP